jgi:glucose-6-phosphate 1-dehydrogenase
MEAMQQMDDLMVCRLNTGRKQVEPCTIVIFGASGDLTARKLIPALFHLFREKQMPAEFRIIGYARREKTHESWRQELAAAMNQFSRILPIDPDLWAEFAKRIFYCQGDVGDRSGYQRLDEMVQSFGEGPLRANLLFYLATSPSQFAEVAGHLSDAGLLQRKPAGWHRLVVEKPFGRDLASAHALNSELIRFAHEQQVFRIDHYLGKETVQNILMFRFSNAIFERLWNREAVDHVQITVSEKNGVGQRGGYYEESGALRDMVQNHLLQVMALMAMEPPLSLDAEAIRDEKVKLLKSIRVLPPDLMAQNAVRGQYFAGVIKGQSQPGYRQEPKVDPASNVETYAALRLQVDNWRWSGVPFFLRTGKCLPFSASEIRVQLRPTPNVLFAAQCGQKLDANALTIRLQPNEGITLRINGKVPGISTTVTPVRMHFSYNSEFGAYTPEAYERLLLDALTGDATLFIRRDEVEAAWNIVDAVRAGWDGQPLTNREFYAAGTWGPPAAEELLAKTGHAWREPQMVTV